MANFAVVDVETTGGYARHNGITEIGIVRIEEGVVVERWHSLVHTPLAIPIEIENLTGISQDMVAEAPAFVELVPEIERLTNNATFVAHHVEFDFSFVQAAMKAAGANFNPGMLCTVRYAKALLPTLKRYSLKRLTQYFSVVNSRPHRALPDAEATAEVLLRMLELDHGQKVVKQLTKRKGSALKQPVHLNLNYLEELPETPGVYQLIGAQGKPLYVGKAINLRQRVPQHFHLDWDSGKSQRLLREVRSISTTETGSEELALLLEDHLIRHFWPPLNRAQKNPEVRWGVVHYQDRTGKSRLALNKLPKRAQALREFYSNTSGTSWLYRVVEHFQLDPSCCGFPPDAFGHEVVDHEAGMRKLLEAMRMWYAPSLLRLPGRTEEEHAWILHRGEKPLAFAFGHSGGPEGEWVRLSPSGLNCSLLERLLQESQWVRRPALPEEEPLFFGE